MTQQPDHEIEPVAADPEAPPRPEEEVAQAVRPDAPVAGGTAAGPPAQGEGEPDSH